jgi:hypothetical protein
MLGIGAGFIAGAWVASNSAKARQMVNDAQTKIKNKMKSGTECACDAVIEGIDNIGGESEAQNGTKQTRKKR